MGVGVKFTNNENLLLLLLLLFFYGIPIRP